LAQKALPETGFLNQSVGTKHKLSQKPGFFKDIFLVYVVRYLLLGVGYWVWVIWSGVSGDSPLSAIAWGVAEQYRYASRTLREKPGTEKPGFLIKSRFSCISYRFPPGFFPGNQKPTTNNQKPTTNNQRIPTQ
jgi:hypothetical protein